MTEFRQRISQLLKSLSKMIKFNKAFIISISVIIIIFFTLSALVSAVKPTIREQQLDTVYSTPTENKKIIMIKETEIKTVFGQDKSHIIAIIDAKDNPSLTVVDKLLIEKKPFQTINWEIDFIQPIYNFNELAKDYHLPAKNNFIVIENGREKGRYSFNILDNGLTTLEEKLNEIIDPKIARKSPKRVKTETSESFEDSSTMESSETQSSTRTKTEEIIFE